jgi:hypothetical protein
MVFEQATDDTIFQRPGGWQLSNSDRFVLSRTFGTKLCRYARKSLKLRLLMFMTRFLKELYLTGFTIGFRLRFPQKYGGGWGAKMDAGKGVLIVSIIMLLILKGAELYLEIFIGKQFSFDSSIWAKIAILLLYFANYYPLIIRGYGIKFEREFNELEKARRTLLVISFGAFVLGSITLTIFSNSAYQHFFHLN